MSILIDWESRVAIQGMTGKFGTYHSQLMLDYGTRIVAGVTPFKGGAEVNGVTVYDTVAEAVNCHGVNVVANLVPAPFVKDAVLECLEAGVRLVVCLAEGVPVKDMMYIKRALQETDTLMLGPNCPGLISPGRSLVGFMPGHIYTPGPVGIVSRSGTFSYQVADALTRAGVGQSTCAGIGGDPITGANYSDILQRFEEDPRTEAIVLIGEIGRTCEEEAAEFIRERISKPVFGVILGATAPPDKQMGHAGAIVAAGRGTYLSKVKALESAGVQVARTATDLAAMVSGHFRDKHGEQALRDGHWGGSFREEGLWGDFRDKLCGEGMMA